MVEVVFRPCLCRAAPVGPVVSDLAGRRGGGIPFLPAILLPDSAGSGAAGGSRICGYAGGADSSLPTPACGRIFSRLLRERLARVSAGSAPADSAGALWPHVFYGGAG